MQRKVLLPDIGDFEDVDVVELLVKPGDSVGAEQSLIVLESDKATMEIPSPFAGVVKALHVKVGDKVSEGSAIATLDVEGADESAAEAQAKMARAPEAEGVREPAQASNSCSGCMAHRNPCSTRRGVCQMSSGYRFHRCPRTAARRKRRQPGHRSSRCVVSELTWADVGGTTPFHLTS